MTKNFVLSHTNVTVMLGEVLRLSCQIDSQPPASLTWTHDEQPLPQNDRYDIFLFTDESNVIILF